MKKTWLLVLGSLAYAPYRGAMAGMRVPFARSWRREAAVPASGWTGGAR